MKKIFTFFLAAAVVLSSFTAVGAADSAAAYGFIESNGKTAKGNVTFNVSKGKTAESLMLNGEEVKEDDDEVYYSESVVSKGVDGTVKIEK